jgi:peptidoglycan hydrolase-like protein with peptidoglycan-binding domain
LHQTFWRSNVALLDRFIPFCTDYEGVRVHKYVRAITTGTLAAALLVTGLTLAPTASAAATAATNCNSIASHGGNNDWHYITPIGGGTELCYMAPSVNYNRATEYLQITLRNCYNQDIAADGYFGGATSRALANAQAAAGAGADGLYGPESRRKLKWARYSGASGTPIGTCSPGPIAVAFS